MSHIVSGITNWLRCDQIPHIKSAAITGGVSWLAQSVTQVGFFYGAGFGLVALAASSVAHDVLKKCGINNNSLNLVLSGAAGCATAYGVSLAAASIVAPVTVPTAVVLTVIALASLLIKLDFRCSCLGHGIEFENYGKLQIV